MERTEIHDMIEAQNAYFSTLQSQDRSTSLAFRRHALTALRNAILGNEERIKEALRTDLGKSFCESYMCEVGMVLEEISFMLRHLRRYTKERRVRTPLSQFYSRSYVKPVPFGTVLIMSPWNYPFLLTLGPLVDALAAGNTAVVKPSAYSPATSACVKDLLAAIYPPEYVTVITGGRAENACLLDEKFDKIFFTGSKAVGIEVMQKAARHLTPVILELGGKSPCIVDETANIRLAARRIVFGKYLNCGQTCVAPDYVLCHASIKDAFVSAVKEEIVKQYGAEPLKSADYGKIINQKHFDRLLSLIDRDKVVHGGEYDREALQIEPTVMDHVTRADAVMGEEIFGPILPILTYEALDDAIDSINAGEKPLALYLFTEDRAIKARVTTACAYGGGCINDCIIHLATTEMGFGGVGESGMGSYHGKAGFDAFTHYKSIVDKSTRIDLPMRYHPYGKNTEKTLHKFLK